MPETRGSPSRPLWSFAFDKGEPLQEGRVGGVDHGERGAVEIGAVVTALVGKRLYPA
jgi:hypothetical protein